MVIIILQVFIVITSHSIRYVMSFLDNIILIINKEDLKININDDHKKLIEIYFII